MFLLKSNHTYKIEIDKNKYLYITITSNEKIYENMIGGLPYYDIYEGFDLDNCFYILYIPNYLMDYLPNGSHLSSFNIKIVKRIKYIDNQKEEYIVHEKSIKKYNLTLMDLKKSKINFFHKILAKYYTKYCKDNTIKNIIYQYF